MIDLNLNTDIRSLSVQEAHKKIDGINQVAEHFFFIKNFDDCKYCAKIALELAEAINYLKGIGEAKYSLAKISVVGEDYFSSIQNLSEAEKIFESTKDTKNCAKVNYELGLSYWYIGDYQNESESFFKALDLYRQLKFLKQEGDCLNSLGNYFVETGDFESSLEYHKMSLNIKRKIKDVRGIIFSLYNIALIHNNIAAFGLGDDYELAQKHYKISLKYYKEALEFNQKLEKDVFLEKRILQNLAINYSNCEETEKASEMLLECIDYYTKTKNDIDKCDSLIYLGIIYTKNKEWEKAEESFMSALKITEILHSSRHSNSLYRNLAEMYRLTGDYKSALFYARKRTTLDLEKSKTLTDNNIRKLNVLHKVDIEKKNTEILAEKNKELQKINNELQRLNTEKNYFLNLAANDLKIPLGKISDKVHSIKSNKSESRLSELSEILTESSHIQKIISDLLSINESQTAK